MIIEVERKWKTNKSTIGEMFVDCEPECFTLEDVVRDVKIKWETAIPPGVYPVIINESKRFGRRLPLLIGVAGFEGIRIHPGNRAENTEGCILVGRTRGTDFIGESRLAFDSLFEKMEKAKDITNI